MEKPLLVFARVRPRMECAALLARQRRRDKRPGLPSAARFAIALPASGAYLPDIGCGCSSGVEHNLAKVGVEGSNPFARSKHFNASGQCYVAGLIRARTFAKLQRQNDRRAGEFTNVWWGRCRATTIRKKESHLLIEIAPLIP